MLMLLLLEDVMVFDNNLQYIHCVMVGLSEVCCSSCSRFQIHPVLGFSQRLYLLQHDYSKSGAAQQLRIIFIARVVSNASARPTWEKIPNREQ